MDSLARLSARSVLALVLVAACAPAASPSPSPGGTGWEPETPWERALVDIDDDGRYSKDAALRLFATAYGPLPGMDVRQDLTGVFSRSIAIRAVDRVRDELTQEQRDAIDRYLAPPADAVKIVIPPVAASGPIELAMDDGAIELLAERLGTGDGPVALADSATEQAIRDVGKMSREVIAAQLKRDFLGEHTFYFVPRPTDVQPVEGLYPNGGTHGIYEGGVFASCQTTIYDEATGQSAVQLAALIAHETFHCFQGDAYRTVQPWNTAPHWVSEGQATWVGLEVGGPSPNYARFWKKYLTAPTIDLRTRDYDAVGFYAHLAETGIDPWTIFQAQWAAGTDHFALFTAAGADNEAFLDSWASSVLREPGRSEAWDTDGPGITGDRYAPPAFVVGNGGQVDVSAAFFTNNIRSLTLNADLVRITAEGHFRLNDGTGDRVLHDGALYCVTGHDCGAACPGEDPPKTDGTIGSRVLVATSGSTDGSIGRVVGIKNGSPDACDEDPDVPPPPGGGPGTPGDPGSGSGRSPCATRCGQSNGDVHVGTLGDYGYDFQGVGEFVLARSADGRFEVQTRQSPLGDSNRISINTALAVKAGDHRMALYLDVLGSTARMTVDGVETALTAPVAWGAGSIVPSAEGVRIDTGDGSFVDVIGMSYRGFNLLVEPGPARLEGIVGLMGANPIDSRWPALPDGSAIAPITTDRHTDYTQLYETLANAWRVTPATALFDYAAGESTETFQRREFPAEADLVYLADLTPAQREAGEAACTDVTDADLHKMCVFDVGVTSDPGYGDLYETTVQLIETGQLGGSGERVRVVNLYANEGRATDLDIYAWAGDATNLGTNSGTGPAFIATVPYGQSSAWFNPGQLSNGPFAPVNWISIQRRGEPIIGWQFSLIDLARDSKPGLDRVILVTQDSPDELSLVGGTAATYSEILEEVPDGFPFIDAPAGKALAFLNPFGMFQLQETQYWVASVGGRCLTDPEFPTLARTAQGFAPYPLLLEPGSFEVAVHAFPTGADGFDLDCARFPVAARAQVTVAAGERVHLFVYAESATAPVQLLALPVGD